MKEFIDKLIERLEELSEVDICEISECTSADCAVCVQYNLLNKAISIVNQLAEEYADNEVLSMIQMNNDFQKAKLEELKQIRADLMAGGWIPCEKELPEDGVVVDLSCEYMGVLYETVGYLKNGNRGHSYIVDNDVFMRSAVLAWRKRPAPYKPKEIT